MKDTTNIQVSEDKLNRNLADFFSSDPELAQAIISDAGYNIDEIVSKTLKIIDEAKRNRRLDIKAQSDQLLRSLYSGLSLIASLSRGESTKFTPAFHRNFEGMNESDKNSMLNDEALLSEWESHYSPTKPPDLSNPEDLINFFAVTSPKDIDLQAIAFECNVLIEEKQIDGAEGRLVCRDLTGLITIDSKITERTRKRFTVAHELGHFMMHRSNALSVCKNLFNARTNSESEANKFGANLLMPRNLFRARCEPNLFSCNLLKDLANTFDTSLTATALQYSEIGPVPIAVVYSKAGKISWPPKISEGFPLKNIQKSGKIPEASVAASCYNRGTNPQGPSALDSSVWFSDSQSSPKRIFEDCVYMPNYESVLSIIWMHNG